MHQSDGFDHACECRREGQVDEVYAHVTHDLLAGVHHERYEGSPWFLVVPLPQQGHARGEKQNALDEPTKKTEEGALGGHLGRQAVAAMGDANDRRGGEGMRSGWRRAVGPDRSALSRWFSLGSLVFSGRDGGSKVKSWGNLGNFSRRGTKRELAMREKHRGIYSDGKPLNQLLPFMHECFAGQIILRSVPWLLDRGQLLLRNTW